MAEPNSFHCLAELFCIALCLASVSFACGTSMTLLTTLKKLLFRVFLRIASRRATPFMTLLTTLKNLLLSVFPRIASEKTVGEQLPL